MRRPASQGVQWGPRDRTQKGEQGQQPDLPVISNPTSAPCSVLAGVGGCTSILTIPLRKAGASGSAPHIGWRGWYVPAAWGIHTPPASARHTLVMVGTAQGQPRLLGRCLASPSRTKDQCS